MLRLADILHIYRRSHSVSCSFAVFAADYELKYIEIGLFAISTSPLKHLICLQFPQLNFMPLINLIRMVFSFSNDSSWILQTSQEKKSSFELKITAEYKH